MSNVDNQVVVASIKHAIYKYPLKLERFQLLPMPMNVRMLCIQMQRGVPTLWAQCEVDESVMYRKIRCYPTGVNDGPIVGQYIGTVQQLDGDLIWHYYDEGPNV
jgi:hypothetical protein